MQQNGSDYCVPDADSDGGVLLSSIICFCVTKRFGLLHTWWWFWWWCGWGSVECETWWWWYNKSGVDKLGGGVGSEKTSRILLKQLLCIATSERVHRTPCAGRNNLALPCFSIFFIFFRHKQKKEEKAQKISRITCVWSGAIWHISIVHRGPGFDSRQEQCSFLYNLNSDVWVGVESNLDTAPDQNPP